MDRRGSSAGRRSAPARSVTRSFASSHRSCTCRHRPRSWRRPLDVASSGSPMRRLSSRQAHVLAFEDIARLRGDARRPRHRIRRRRPRNAQTLGPRLSRPTTHGFLSRCRSLPQFDTIVRIPRSPSPGAATHAYGPYDLRGRGFVYHAGQELRKCSSRVAASSSSSPARPQPHIRSVRPGFHCDGRKPVAHGVCPVSRMLRVNRQRALADRASAWATPRNSLGNRRIRD